jgi:hypothetical protein
VKFEVNVKKCGRGNSFCSLFLFKDIWVYINGIQLAKFGLLIERTSYTMEIVLHNSKTACMKE